MLLMMMGIKAGDGVGYADGRVMAMGWSCSCSPELANEREIMREMWSRGMFVPPESVPESGNWEEGETRGADLPERAAWQASNLATWQPGNGGD